MLVRFNRQYMGIKSGETREVTELAYNQLGDIVDKVETGDRKSEILKEIKHPPKDKMVRADKTYHK